MAGDTIKCPHCECKVKVSDVEKEDGLCPECGQLVMASSLQNDYDQDDIDDDLQDEFDSEYDHEGEEEDEFDDEYDPDFGEEDDEAFFDEELKPKRSLGNMIMGSSRRSEEPPPPPAPRKSTSGPRSRGSRKK